MKVRHKWRYVLLAALLLCVVAYALLRAGIVQLNHPSNAAYPVRGVDVSAYQGEVDWDVLSAQGIDFAYIKATEGSSFVDPCFAQNRQRAAETPLRTGAYHFFSFESSGDTQADNFIAQVPKWEGMLPPAVDVEFYGAFRQAPLPAGQVQAQLDIMLARLEQHYGVRPILYATQSAYARYLADYDGYDIWIRNVFTRPQLGARRWAFWQYTDRARLQGYDGEERFIDMNVFNGSRAEFEVYGLK